MITIGSLFSGAIDGMSLGFLMASSKYKPIISNELEKTAVKTAKLNYKHKIVQDDIRNMSIDKYKSCDIILGTFPCQEYSRAANIHKQGRENNYKQAFHWASIRDLFLHFFRFIAINQPEVYLWENSPEIRKFPIVMETFRKLPPYKYYELNLDTFDFKLPQKRKRLFVIGFRKKYTMTSPLTYQCYKRQLTIKDIKEKDVHINIPNYVRSRIDGKYRDLPSIKLDNDIGNTCVAHYSRDRGTTLIQDKNGYKGLRPFTVREYARLMGIPDWFKFANADTTNYRHIGNGVSPVVVQALAKAILPYFIC
jgi:DNA (cytosine-5)-methyltransferase 1